MVLYAFFFFFFCLVQVCEIPLKKIFLSEVSLKLCLNVVLIIYLWLFFFFNIIDGFKVYELTVNELHKNLLMIQGGIE